MNRREPQARYRGSVSLRAVPFMFAQPVAGMPRVEFAHECVAFGLREDRRASDAQATRIAFKDGCLWNVGVGEFKAEIGQ